jgi:peptidyl-prolyl cis-trans isomerase D
MGTGRERPSSLPVGLRKWNWGAFIFSGGIGLLLFLLLSASCALKDRSDIVAEVSKYKITADEYRRTYQTALEYSKYLYQDKFNEAAALELKKKVLDEIIDQKAFLLAAQEADIKVTDEELKEAISQDPSFQKSGAFDREVYEKALQLNNLTPEKYEKSKREELVLEKMRERITSSVSLTDAEIKGADGDEAALAAILAQKKETAIKDYTQEFKKKLIIKVNRKLLDTL